MNKIFYSILFSICCILSSCDQKEYRSNVIVEDSIEQDKYVIVEQSSFECLKYSLTIFEITNKETDIQYTILYEGRHGRIELIDKTEKK